MLSFNKNSVQPTRPWSEGTASGEELNDSRQSSHKGYGHGARDQVGVSILIPLALPLLPATPPSFPRPLRPHYAPPMRPLCVQTVWG